MPRLPFSPQTSVDTNNDPILKTLRNTPKTFLHDLIHFSSFLCGFVLQMIFFIGHELTAKKSKFPHHNEFYKQNHHRKAQVPPPRSRTPSEEHEIHNPSSYFLPTRSLITHVVISFLQYLAAHPRSNMRRFRALGKGAEYFAMLKAKYDLGLFLKPKPKHKRTSLVIKRFAFEVKPEYEIDLEEDNFGWPDQAKLKGPRTLKGDWFLKKSLLNKPRGKVMLYYHGGGYCAFSPTTHRPWTARLADQTGMEVFSLDYRLSPEFPFPAAIHDAFAMYQYVLQELDVSPEDIIIAGDSAGGGLCMALLQILHRHSLPYPAGAYLVSPWADLSKEIPTLYDNYHLDFLGILLHPDCDLAKMYAGRRSTDIDEFVKMDLVSPAVSPNLPTNLPPILIQASPHEQLSHSIVALFRNLISTAPKSNVTFELYEGMVHVFHIIGDIIPLVKGVDIVQVSVDRFKNWVKNEEYGVGWKLDSHKVAAGSSKYEEEDEEVNLNGDSDTNRKGNKNSKIGQTSRRDSGTEIQKRNGKSVKFVLREGKVVYTKVYSCKE